MTISIEASQGSATPLPTRLFSARDMGELTLQRIGAYTTMHDAADPVELERTLYWMELAIADLSGRVTCEFLKPAVIQFSLEDDGTNPYVLADVAGSAYPSLGIASVISAKTIDANGVESPVTIIRKADYEAFNDKTTSGTPDYAYLSRLNGEDELFTYPVYRDTSNAMSMRLSVVTYPRSVLGPIGESQPSGNVAHGFDRAWQSWLVHATAALVGAGPVRRLKASDLNEIKGVRDFAENQLMAYQNREKYDARTQRTRRRDW
jgi:hypothetical protein